MYRMKPLVSALVAVVAFAFAGVAFAQEGKTYRVTYRTGDGDVGVVCAWFSEGPLPGLLTMTDADEGPADATWAHWKNGKNKKWFFAIGDSGDWLITGKKVGNRKIKGDLMAAVGDDDLMQATFVGVLEPDCVPPEPAS